MEERNVPGRDKGESVEEIPCTTERIVNHIKNLKNVRTFGLFLKIEPGRLDEIEQSSSMNKREQIVEEWFRSLDVNKSDTDRWEELCRVLLEPAVGERTIAYELATRYLRRGPSVDSAISSLSSSASPLVYYETKECSILNVLNYIAQQDNILWYDIGLALQLPRTNLNRIKEYSTDREAHLVELWHRHDPDSSWEKLRQALNQQSAKQQVAMKLSRNTGTVVERGDVELEIEALHDRFHALIKDVKESLGLEKVHETLLTLPPRLNFIYSKIIVEEDLKGCKSHEDLFLRLNSYWNFIDSELLERIVKKHGSDKLKSEMRKYVNDVKEFRKRTSVHQLVEGWEGSAYKPFEKETYKRYIARLGRDPKTCTLEELEILRKISANSICDQPLSTAALILHEVTICCVTIVWLVAREDVSILFDGLSELIRSDFVARHGIEFLSLDGHILFPVEEYWNACRKGCFKHVRELLERGTVDPDYTCETLGKQTVLMCAAEHGHFGVVELLLEFGAAVDQKDETDCTALTIATQAGHFDIAKILLEKGADLNLQEKVHGTCPLLIAIAQGNLPVVKLCVLSPEVDLNVANWEGKTALILAIERGDAEILDVLLHVDSVDLRINISHMDETGRTAVHVAVDSDDENIVRRLIGIFPDARDMMSIQESQKPDQELASPEGDVDSELTSQEGSSEQEVAIQDPAAGEAVQGEATLFQRGLSTVVSFVKQFRFRDIRLMRAAKTGKHEKVQKLLKVYKANPNTKEIDTLQWTPLIWASHRGHEETVKVLLKYGADPNITSTNGHTALILASRKGHHNVVRLLLDPSNQIRVDVNAKNNTRGWSALMWASQTYAGTFRTKGDFLTEKAMANRREVAKVLLEAGADVNSEADNGWTPLMQACQDGDVEFVKILANAEGVKIDHQSKVMVIMESARTPYSTWSALTTACRRRRGEIVKVLVDAGADVNIKKKGGITALHIASYKDMKDTVKVLLSAKIKTDVDIQDEWGMTPLIMAAKQKFCPMVEYLVTEANANVNIKAERYAQWSALFFAVKSGDQATVDILMQNNAEAGIKDENGHTPLSYSKGLLLQKKVQMYKHLVSKQEDSARPVASQEPEAVRPVTDKPFTPGDGIFYNRKEAIWRATQLPNILLNI